MSDMGKSFLMVIISTAYCFYELVSDDVFPGNDSQKELVTG